MYYTEKTEIQNIVLHGVGNKFTEQGVKFSKNNLVVNEETLKILRTYFLLPFKTNVFHNLFHESDINFNLVFVYVNKIFDKPNLLQDYSKELAKHLYERSDHPKIKGGEFYTVYFKDCIIDGETVDAVGLFKSENKDTFLKVFPNKTEDGFEIESDKGININKLDKGCLIFNTEKENGYIVAVVDNTNRGIEAQYWLDDFLHVRQRNDEYFNTKNMMSMCKNFVKNELPQQFEVTKADQADFLNKSLQFFKEKDNFNLSEFANEVIGQPDIIEKFNQYKSIYSQEYDVDFADNFTISDSAVKKQTRALKSIIKLDKNFDIHIHNNRQLIEQGEDEKGKYYKIYFDKED